ncbi:MAG: hypothetical protein ABJO27_08810 [Pseudoruegeria sp.]
MLDYLAAVEQLNSAQVAPSAAEDLEYIIHFFFDDTELAREASNCIGTILSSNEEARAIALFGKALNSYLNSTSPENSPVTFEENDDWKSVKDSAQNALNELGN